MKIKDNIKFFLLIVLAAGVIANTAISYMIALQLRDDRAALESLEKGLKNVKEALDIEIALRQQIFPQLQKSACLLRQYNPQLDYMTALSYAWKIHECSDETVRFDILNALIIVESGADHRAVSINGALGLTQVMPGVWKYDYATLLNPYQNIEIGAAILKTYIQRHGLEGGLSAYSSGRKSADPAFARRVQEIAQLNF